MSERASRRQHLDVLMAAAQRKASALAFDRELARLSYAIASIEPGSVQALLWLGRSLATLGDEEGMAECFRRAAAIETSTSERRGITKAYERAKRLLTEAPAREYVLQQMRARGWASVDQTIQMAPRLAKPERRCPKCEGWGYLQWFREQDRGRCYVCNGTGYVER
jgi:hypothetical protein